MVTSLPDGVTSALYPYNKKSSLSSSLYSLIYCCLSHKTLKGQSGTLHVLP